MKAPSHRIEAREVLRCALISFCCAFLCFVPFLFRDGGWFHVWADFGQQQVPFGISLHHALEGMRLGGWNWSWELGMSIIQAFSFYILGSPFYWLSLLFPAEWYPMLMGWLYLLKYTVAGVTSYCYIRRFVKRESSAMAGALMYAFSGFQAVNLMYFHFHDVVAFFPLLMIGIEKVLKDPKDRAFMIFAVFLNALTNYYFLVIEAVFSVLYYLFRFFMGEDRTLRRFLRESGSCLLSALWGSAMAAVLLVPSVLFVLSSPRSHPKLFLNDLIRSSRWVLFVLKGLVLPGDTAVNQLAFYRNEYSSTVAWMPLAGVGLALALMLKKNSGSWLKGLLILLLCLAFSPLLGSGFLLLTEYTGRWFMTLTLMLALASARVMDQEEEYPVKKALGIYFLLVAGYCFLLYTRPYDVNSWREILDMPRFILYAGIALAGILGMLALSHFRLLRSWIATALVFLFAAAGTFLPLNNYYNYTGDGVSKAQIRMGMQLETRDDQYRYGLLGNQLSLPGGGSSLQIFSSTVSRGVMEFDDLFDYYSTNQSLNKSSVRGLPELLGARYFVSTEESGTVLQKVGAEGETRYVTEKEACPIGFAVDRYILQDDLAEIAVENRGVALLYAAVIGPEEEAKVSGLCGRATGADIPLEEDLTGIVKRNQENAVTEFTRDSRGFRCVSDFVSDRLVYFSVPDEGGWSARVDGQKQEILPSGGMMLLRVPAGHHEIVFTYVTPGYTAGKYISLLSIIAFGGWLIIRKTRKGQGK